MPATDLERLVIQLEADLSKLNKNLAEANGLVDNTAAKIERRTAQMKSSVEGAFLSLGAQLAAAFSVASLVRFGEALVQSTAKLSEQAQQLQVSAETMQAYHIAAEESGTSTEAVDLAIGKLNKTLGDAANGSIQARQFFQRLGTTFQEIENTAPNERLARIAQLLLQVSDGTKRAALETDLFGRSGRQLESSLATLAQGAAKLTAEYKEQGRIISDELARKTDAAVDSLTASWERLKTAAVPTLSDLAVRLADMAASLAGMPVSMDTLIGRFQRLQALANNNKGTGFGDTAQGLADVAAQNVINRRNSTLPLLGPDSFQPKLGGGGAATISELDQFLAKMKLMTELAGETASQREIDQKLIEAATIKLKEEGRAQEVILDSMQKVNQVLDEQAGLRDRIAKSVVDTDLRTADAAFKDRQTTAREASAGASGIPDKDLIADLKKRNLEAIDAAQKQNAVNDKQLETQNKLLGGLQAEVDLAGMLPREREAELEIMRLQERSTTELTEATKKQIRQLVEQRQQAQELEAIREKAIDGLAELGATALTSGGNIKQMFASLIQYMAQYIIKLEIARSLESALGSSTGGSVGGGIIGTLIGSIFGSRDTGGPVAAGTPYMIGKGAYQELFVPNQAGYVVPNMSGKGAGGGTSMVHVVIGASPEFDAKMIRVSAGTATQVVAHYDRNTLPSRVGQLNADNRLK